VIGEDMESAFTDLGKAIYDYNLKLLEAIEKRTWR
jgi:hypothetical protein